MSQCPADSYATLVPRGSVYSSSHGIVVISAADERTELDVYSTGQVDTRIAAAALAQTNQTNTSGTTAATNLAAETSRATAAESAISAAVTAETSRATAAESGLRTSLTAETSRATAAESGLHTSLTAETTRATTAESALATTFASYLPLAGGTMSAPINMASHAITNLPSPSNASDAVCKSYVDNVSAGLTAYPSVRAYIASTAGYTYANGVAGVGATLTVVNSASTPLVFDGYTPLVGERVLVNSSTNLHANGIYILTTSRVSGNTCVFTRAEYFDGDPLTEIHPGAMFYVTAGTVYANTSFVQVSPIPATVGVSPVQYTQFSALPIIVNGPNVNIVGNQIGVTPTLTNIAAVQLASTPSAGTVTLQQSPASSTYTVSLPAAAPTANAMLKYDGTNYAWSALSAGANIGVSGMQVGMSPTLSQINSVALQHADASSGVLTVSKASGSASYALALPAAAPAAGNVLTCSGAGTYAWSSPQTLVAGSNLDISGSTISLQPAVTLAGTLDLDSHQIKHVSEPTDTADAATKNYTDASLATQATATAAAISAGDATALQAAKTYADSGIAAGVSAAEAYALSNCVNKPAYGLVLPSSAPAAGNILTYSGSNAYAWSAPQNLAAGRNISTADSTIAVASALTQINSVALQHADASAGVVTLGKTSGSASYGVNMPAAAPVAGDALVCTGSGAYAWQTPQNLSAGANLAISGSTISIGVSGDIDMAGYKLTNLPQPTSAGDAVCKSYVDTLAAGLILHPAVQCYMTDISAYTYTDGPLGATDTLTVQNSSTTGLVVDGYTCANYDRILVNSATNTAYNGVYVLYPNGVSGANIVLTRAADENGTSAAQLQQGSLFYVVSGTDYTGTLFAQISVMPAASSIGTAPIVYTQFSPRHVLTQGANIVVSNNAQISLAAALGGINSVALQHTDASAGVVTLSKSSGSASYALALPSAAPATGNVLTCSGSGAYSWSAPVQAGTNVGVSGNTVALNAALSGINSVALRHADASAGVVTVSKSSGAASYALALPAAAPSANTALVYDGSNYVWGAASGGSGGSGNVAAIAMQVLYVDIIERFVPTVNGAAFPFNTVKFAIGTSGVITPSPSTTSISTFTLAAGYTYKCVAQVGQNNSSTDLVYQWSTMPYVAGTTTVFGAMGTLVTPAARNHTAIGYITTTATTTIALVVLVGGGNTVTGDAYGFPNLPWATIEVVSGNAISAFTGATSSTNGVVGYIPAPPAGTQNSYLRGDGTWQQANNAPTAAAYLHVANKTLSNVTIAVNQPFQYTDIIASASSVISVNSPITTFTLLPGYSYKCTAAMTWTNNTELRYQWSNVTAGLPGTVFGLMAIQHPSAPLITQAIGYIANNTATNMLISVIVTQTATVVTSGNIFPYAIIEVVSNNNTITAFSGATSSTSGTVGYIPAPPAGTQNSYLRGDGTWQQANNAPTAAAFCLMQTTLSANSTLVSGNNITFDYMQISTGLSFTVPTNTFTLLAGYSYKLSGLMNGGTASNIVCWYNVTSSTYIGTPAVCFVGWVSTPSVAYITCAYSTVVSLRCSGGGSALVAVTSGPITSYGWASIEVVSNNNTIAAFSGATSSTSGTVGYIPAPPAGTQNSYLRGDGTWVQANNAPTAANYLFVTHNAAQSPAVGAAIAFNTVWSSNGSITQPTTSSFLLPAGASYRCTAAMQCTNNQLVYQFYNGSVAFGSAGQISNATGLQMAIGYITTTDTAVTITIKVWVNSGNIPAANVSAGGMGPWLLIEQISNNNAITAFSGATGSAAGSIGYIPAPAVGQQTYYLTGAGTWQPPPSLAGTGTIYQAVYNTISDGFTNTTWTDVPNLTLTLTPNSTGSKFLIRANIIYGLSGASSGVFRFMRGTTPIGVGVGGSYQGSFRSFDSGAAWAANACGEFLDAPATTSAITYSVQFILYTGFTLVFNNATGGASGTADNTVCQSTLTITQC